ncbi:hypothetical protein L2E82_10020 [Cichorium intybus]|uniref:Uncharacterized protein n=1 Tax=Cichorium intybus TaxID=13427 RepID=A0ACB9G9G8_CICIN|nr:hypothetical protein L2E82_10020 [Cichorium intybus]
MEIIDLHHPLILVFGILGNIVSTGVYFAPMPTIIQICKQRSPMGFQTLPYVVSLFSALLWMYYAFIKEGDTFLLITVNALGTFVEFIYVIIFIVFAIPSVKKQTIKILSATMVLCLVISLGSFFFLEGVNRALVVGWICVGVSVCVFAAPLTIVFQVVKTKSVDFMPLPLSCFLTLSAMTWFAYGMFTADLCVTVPNVLGFVLGIIQMALYKYYKQRSKVPSIPEIKHQEHIINIKTSNSEVYPVDSSWSSGIEAEEEKNTAKDGGSGRGEVLTDNKCGPRVMEVVNVKPVLIVYAA